ncbi:MAG: glycosyltransferase [Planctomycetes bacterium]|nr:glycosyltransferase [Planctomycetota bacterium]
MYQPRITVIIPNLNQGEFIERAICSVLDQGYANLECFVVDGGSTDESCEIIELYEDQLAGWMTAPDRGPGDAVNKALLHATGDIVTVLHSDDMLLPGALHAVAERMSRADAPRWVVGNCLRIGPGDQMLGRSTPALPESFAAFLMHDSGLLPPPATFWSRAVIDRFGPFDAGLRVVPGYDFACRLMAEGEKPTLIGETLAARREYAISRSATQTILHGREQITVARRYAHHLPLPERYALWRNCDRRERIYASAEAEIKGSHAQRYILNQVVRHPWWIADDTIRHLLRSGVAHPLPAEMIRPAA